MKVKGLDGRQYNMMLTGYVPLGNEERVRSQYHLLARDLLNKTFPCERILEEISLPGSGGLIVDFFIPLRKVIVEVHGEQHYKYIPFFHQTPLGFIASKKRDANKKRWCEINNIEFIELAYSEEMHVWRNKLRGKNAGYNKEN